MSEEKVYSKDAIKFQHPFTCVLSGATMSGKTHLLTQIILNSKNTINKPLDNLLYCYGSWLDDTFKVLKNELGSKVTFKKGFHESDLDSLDKTKFNFIILDDLMNEAVTSEAICNLFTRGSHHHNLSVFLLTQNLFQQGKFARTINLNAHYLIYFKNPRDQQQIGYIGRQMLGSKGGQASLQEAYEDCIIKPHGYLVLDFKQQTPTELRIRTNILPSEKPCIVYIQREK